MAVLTAPSRLRRPRIRWGRHIEGYLVISPWLIGFVAFTAGPMIASAYLSLTRYDLLSPPRWIGIENFSRMLADDLFPTALLNTLFYTVLAVPSQVLVALLMALALNRQLRGIGFFRAAFYLPTVMPSVANVMLWLWIFNPDLGIANAILRLVGLSGINWLTDPNLAKPSLILMSLWRVGSQMVIFLAGLQSVPDTLHEAAAIDGASRLQRLWNVTLPMISPVIFFNVIVGVIDSFQIFTVAFIATGGGPVNATYFYVLHLYDEGFSNFHMGYASSLAWVLFAIILVFTIGQFLVGRQWVYYEGGERK